MAPVLMSLVDTMIPAANRDGNVMLYEHSKADLLVSCNLIHWMAATRHHIVIGGRKDTANTLKTKL